MRSSRFWQQEPRRPASEPRNGGCGFGVRVRIAHSQGHEARFVIPFGSPCGWTILGCGGAARGGRSRQFFRSGPGRVGPRGGDDGARAAAVLHRLPQVERPVRSLRRRLSAALCEPERGEEAGRSRHGDAVDALRPHARYAHITSLRCDPVLPEFRSSWR